MKFRKPADLALHKVEAFINSLPDEFEILGPGEVAVKWPGGLTREYLLRSSRGEYGTDISLRAWLEALADIAPEKKKRKELRWVGWHEGAIVMRDYPFNEAVKVEI